MNGPPSLDIVWTSFPDLRSAEDAASRLVAEGLVACAQLMAPMRTVYRWRGAIERAEEIGMLCKVAAGGGPKAAARITELHPYDLPTVSWWPAGCAPTVAAWATGAG